MCATRSARESLAKWHRFALRERLVCTFRKSWREVHTRSMLVACVDSWMAFVQRSTHKADLIRRAIQAFRESVSLRAMNAWREKVARAVITRAALEDAVLRWQTYVCHASMRCWLAYVDAARVKRMLLTRAIGHWQRGSLRGRFRMLRVYCLEHRRAKRARWAASVSHYSTMLLKDVLARWCAFVMRSTTMASMKSMAFSFFRYTALSRCTMAWCEFARRSRHQALGRQQHVRRPACAAQRARGATAVSSVGGEGARTAQTWLG